MNLGERLRAARKRKGWTQIQLVEHSGVKQGTISQIERGDQEKSIFVVPLATALGVSPEWLESGTEAEADAQDAPSHKDLADKELRDTLAELRPKEKAGMLAMAKSIIAAR